MLRSSKFSIRFIATMDASDSACFGVDVGVAVVLDLDLLTSPRTLVRSKTTAADPACGEVGPQGDATSVACACEPVVGVGVAVTVVVTLGEEETIQSKPFPKNNELGGVAGTKMGDCEN